MVQNKHIVTNKKKTNALTEGSIIKALFTLSLPIVFANILQTVYHLIDTFWVGRLGAEAVAAVSLSFPIFFLLLSLGAGLSIAGAVLVAQYKGKGEQSNINYIAAQTILMMFTVAAIITIVGWNISSPIIEAMKVEQTVFIQAVAYLKIIFLGMIFLFGYFVFQSLMRGVGDVKTPLYIVSGSVILNFIFDPLFILGYGPIPALGVSGAAIATILTQGLGSIAGFIMLFSGRYGIHLKRINLKPDFFLIKKIFKLALPASLEQSARALGFLVMVFLATSFGTQITAAYGIGARILSFVVIPAVGFSMATSTLVGQNIGAGQTERAERTSNLSALISFVMLTVAGIIFFIFARPLTALFIPGDTEVITLGTQFIKIIALSFGFIGIQHTYNGTFRGSGNTGIAMTLTIINLWVLQFPIAYLLSKHTSLEETGIWLAFAITNVVAALIGWIWFRKSSWKNKNLAAEFDLSSKALKEIIIEEGLQ